MRIPVFHLQIVDAYTGEVVQRFGAGSAVERELIAAITTAVGNRSVGLFRTKAQVQGEVTAAMNDVFNQFKQSVTRGGD